MVEESQLNKRLSSVLEEQNGERYLCEEGIHSNEENEENDDNFPTEIKVTITNKLLENTEAKTEEEENTLQKDTDIWAAPSKDKKILMSEVREENEMRKKNSTKLTWRN